MPKRVGIEWEESQYTTEASNLESFHSAMESTGSQFTSQVETSNANLDTAISSVEGSWSDDDVFSKLKSMVDKTLKGGLQSIDTDVTSGSFLSLKNTVNLCKTCMDNCKQAKHDYDTAKNLFEHTSSTKEVDDPDNPGKKKTVHNDDYDTRQADVEKKLNILKNKVTSANTHLYELAQFAFGGPSSKNNIGGESTTGAGGIGATPPHDDDFVPVDGVTVAGEDVSEVAAMASGLATPTSENVDSEVINNGDTDQDGLDNYTEDRHTEQEFETDGGLKAERTEDLTVTGEVIPGENGADDTLVPEHAEGEAHYTTTNGETYTGDIEIDYTNGGASYQKNESITSDATGEHVADVGTHQVIDYNDSTTGADVNVTDRRIEQGDTVVERRDKNYEGQSEDSTIVQSSEWSYKKPAEGQPITEGTYKTNDDFDGLEHTYTYAYNEKGELVETNSYYNPGGFFGAGKGDHVETRVVDTSEVYTLRVTNPDGSVTSTPILVDSQMGQAEVARQYENAMMDQGYKADYAREGIHHLWMGDGSPVEVSSPWGDGPGYTFELVPSE